MKCPDCEEYELEEIAPYSPIEVYAYECKNCGHLFERKYISFK